MRKIILVSLFYFFSMQAVADEETESAALYAQQLMATGKLTGGCGIFRLQIIFQENTELENGEEFLARFWTMEAARLGKTLEEYSQYCHKFTKQYVEQYEMFESQLESSK